MTNLQLRFPLSSIQEFADKYSYKEDWEIENHIAPAVRERGYILQEEFEALCVWKSARIKSKIRKNSAGLIQEATRVALSAKYDEMRIGALLVLHGVYFPVASAILHFTHSEKYPILDYRALWSLGIEKPPSAYTMNFWNEYTVYCRSLAEKAGVSMRILDRSLWQYSKDKQK